MIDQFLNDTLLFKGIEPEEISEILACLKAEQKAFQKDEIIYRQGSTACSIGIVLTGSVHIESHDFWGNKGIWDEIGPGQVFAETYACLPQERLMIDVTAARDSLILFLNARRLLTPCSNACPKHARLIQNLLAITAKKNLNLSRRIYHTSPKTIRGKVLSYLSFQAARQGSDSFSIPFDRQQLADYLGVDRSALSNELGKMRREGLLSFKKNHFYIRQP